MICALECIVNFYNIYDIKVQAIARFAIMKWKKDHALHIITRSQAKHKCVFGCDIGRFQGDIMGLRLDHILIFVFGENTVAAINIIG